MIGACIIGVSGYGRVHYDMLMKEHAAGNLSVAGATVINPDEEAEKCAKVRDLGGRIFDDYRLMLEELSGKADLCMIPTGIPLHRVMTVAALEAGMHVLVEKPAAGCIEDVRAMQEARSRAGRIVAVGYQHMYTPSAMGAKRHILDGAIGRLESIKCLVMWPRDHAYYGRNGWAGRLEVGGTKVNDSPFNNAVAHELMMMLFLAGAEERTAASPESVEAEVYRANQIESADTACMKVDTAEGVPIRFYATHACREEFGPEIHIRGSAGSIVMTHGGSVIRPDGKDEIRIASGGAGAGRGGIMVAVLEAIGGGSPFYCDLDLASRQTMVVSAIHDKCDIRQVAGETVTPDDGPARTFIPGVEDAMREAFEAGNMLSGTGADWAGPATKCGDVQ